MIEEKIELIPYNEDPNFIVYGNITNYDLQSGTHPIEKYVSPKEKDYEKGYFTRYFIRKINDNNGQIYEVDSALYKTFISHSIYFGIKLEWRITGQDIEVQNDNYDTILLKDIKMSGLKRKLTNLVKYFRIIE